MIESTVIPFGKEAVEWTRTCLVVVLLTTVVSSIDLLKYNVNIERKLKVLPSSNEL